MKRGFVVTATVMVAIAASLGYCRVKTTQLDAAFKKVKVGGADRDVIVKMGRPHQVLDGCGYYGKRPMSDVLRSTFTSPLDHR